MEVPCVAGERGIEPRAVGALPRHLAALIQTNVNVQGLTVSAALTGRREPAYHAAMLDPHTAAELPLDEIEELVDELLWAHGDLVPPLVLSCVLDLAPLWRKSSIGLTGPSGFRRL